MKLCKHCKYSKKNLIFTFIAPLSRDKWKFARCLRLTENHLGEGFVDGKKLVNYQYCSITRQFGPCFPEAKLFKPK